MTINSTINTNALRLTFDDEFNSFVSSPDGSSGWMTQYPFGGANRTLPLNNEAEYYSDSSVGTNPFSIVNGVLDITATKASVTGANADSLPYNSGLITSYTSFSQLYGYFEVRAELPAGQGLWPAFWLKPTNGQGPELDIFEQLGNDPNTIYSSTHSASGSVMQALSVADTSAGFHTYGVDWEPTTITFYVDGVAVAATNTPSDFNTPMYMLLDLAVGGTGSWPGATNASTTFPATMQIDYVHVYATANTQLVSGTQAIPSGTVGNITGHVAVGTGAGTAIGGVTVSLLDSSAKVLATATTNSTGAYSFTGLAAGTYTVRETPPIGYAALAGSSTTTAALTVTAGVTATAAVLKLAGVGSITGTELLGTTPVAGATVTLLADNANGYYTAATTTTNSAGSYSFSNLYSLNYQVKFTTPSGDTLQSGPANSSTGVTNPITITGTPGQTVALAAETLTKTSTAVTTGASTSASTSTQTSASTATTTGVITGKVAVGVGTGTAIGGVTVSLLDSSAKVLATATTNSTGAYSFTGLAAGTYTVRETPPIGYAALAGSSTTTAALTVTAGVTATAAVLKLAGVGSITGTELLGTTPVAGATVTLLADNANGYYTAATTTTNSAGSYSFSNLYSLNYQVKFTTPSGDTLQSGPANSSTGVTNPITITGTPGQTVALAAETLTKTSTAVTTGASTSASTSTQTSASTATTTGVITGKVAVGVGTGTAIGGVTVSLLDSSAKVLATATTNSTGAYSFTGLAAGTYTVRETPPIGYAALAGSSTTTAALTVTAGVTATAAVLKLAGVGSITGTELLGTTPVAGATVTLLADNANGYYTAATTTTNSAGSYSFSNLYSLNYQVKFTTPSGDTLQSGPANSSTGVTNPITITGTPGQTVALAAETLTKTSTAVTTGASTSASTSTQTSASTATTTGVITGKVAVGVGTGTAIGGVTVSLLDSSAKVLATATTNSTGAYSFTGLAAGTYTVRETPPIGYAALAGSSTTTAALTVTAGVTATAAVLKLAGVGSITGTELLGTTPVAGATVTLLADNANGYYTAATTTTNSAGSYSFSNLYSLNYQVKFTTPSGDTLQSGPANSSTGVTNPITITGTPGQTVALAAEVAATNTTTLSGIGQAVTRIDGNYTVIGTASNSRITLGNGNQTILLTGAGDTITIGSGTSSITAKGGNEIIHTGGGSTTISVTAGGNLLDAGPGMNFITTDGAGSDTFMLNSAEQGLTTISGFSMSHSDVLDLNRTLAGLNVAKDLSNLSNFVTSVVSDGSTTLMVDPTGTHGTASSIAVLKGVSATVDQLITGGHISLT